MTLPQILASAAAALGAGAMNAMAGGGTILTFPTLVFLGMPAIMANATPTVALLPASVTSMVGFRREVSANRRWLKTLFLLLLAASSARRFSCAPEKLAHLAPVLVLFATILFMVRGVLARRFSPSRGEGPVEPEHLSAGHWTLAWILQLGVAVYGGYWRRDRHSDAGPFWASWG